MGSHWGSVNAAPRLAIIAAMPQHEGETTERITVAALARRLGKNPGTIDQMMQALRADCLVDYVVRENRREWYRTHLPIPEKFTSTAARFDAEPFDDRELRAALGIPMKPPPAPTSAKLITFK